MTDYSFSEIVDRMKLQRLQDEFNVVTGLSIQCLSSAQKPLTDLKLPREAYLATEDDAARREGGVPEACRGIVAGLLERVNEGTLEEQAVEPIPGGYAAAIAVRVDDKGVLYWIIFDYQGRELMALYQILDLLRDACTAIFSDRMSLASAEAETRRSHYAEEEMERNLHTIETTTQIVQLLDSDDRIELVMDKWLRILATYLCVDTAQIFKLEPDGKHMGILSEWRDKGRISAFDRMEGLPAPTLLKTKRPLVLSAEGMENPLRVEMEEYGLQAVMAFPILVEEGSVVSLNHRTMAHVWSMEEIKFATDAVKILKSIVTRRSQKYRLSRSYEELEAILDNVGCSVYVTDEETGEMLFANRSLQNTFAAELKEGSFAKLISLSVHKDNADGTDVLYYAARDRWYDLISKEISWMDERRARLCSLYDITDKKNYQRRIEQQAYTDFLTGLYNRMCCERDLARRIDEAQGGGGKGALLYLDLDDFKHINDGLGHQYGDVLLKSISRALRSVNGIENTCYRMGGDEFVIIIPPAVYERFEKILEDIKTIFAKPWFLKDSDYYCTMSMGIVTFPDAGDSVTDLIKKADIAMYEAKKTGKNRVARYSEGKDSISGRRLDMEKNMRDATAEGYREFEVYYQPIIDVWEGEARCVGAEALIRWNSEKLGFISPSEFIPLAEYLGLITPIGGFVLQEACANCKRWNDAGHPEYKVNVNLSVIQLLQPDIVESIAETLKATGLSPANLTLEVTESLAINDMERMKGILGRIKDLGVSLALDDFGTGYSSLNHIREIPIDIIKVDQSFVKDLAEDAYSRSFVKMVAELAQTIGVSVCVEGIETIKQYKALKGMKIKYIQGYYFDRPLIRTAFEDKYVYRQGD